MRISGEENSSQVSQNTDSNKQEAYIQMANLSSGSNFAANNHINSSHSRSSFRSNMSVSNNDQANNQAVYNFPWDFKLKSNPLLVQIQPNGASSQSGGGVSPNNSTAPPPLPTVPPPQTPKISNDKSSNSTLNEGEPEDEYCAPWDLKVQEELLKRMALQQQQGGKDDSNNLKHNDSINSNNSGNSNIKPSIVNKLNISPKQTESIKNASNNTNTSMY
jgi:hypothetical protein